MLFRTRTIPENAAWPGSSSSHGDSYLYGWPYSIQHQPGCRPSFGFVICFTVVGFWRMYGSESNGAARDDLTLSSCLSFETTHANHHHPAGSPLNRAELLPERMSAPRQESKAEPVGRSKLKTARRSTGLPCSGILEMVPCCQLEKCPGRKLVSCSMPRNPGTSVFLRSAGARL